MKDIKCPLCSVNIDKDRYKENYYSKIMNTNYKLYICHACSLEFWNPMAMFKEFYEDELHKDYASLHVGGLRSISQSMNLFFENLPLKSGRLLDVGCGDGIFLEKAREFGFDVWGIDFDSKSIETARKKRNLR
ncbi:MAG: methyltransferase domain-containing protein, partial [Elusimicrobiota bacterium]